jgi:hypothetical protein
MSVGDLVRVINTDAIGMIVELNTDCSVEGSCWHVFYFAYNNTLMLWEYELEVISESG